MAKFVTIHLLLNDDNEAAIEGGIAAMVSMADKDWLIDHEVDLARDCPTEIADAIDNETYSPGDAFKPYILYSLEEATRSDGAGFWSNTYGWTTRDLATRFSLTDGPLNKPVTGGDVILMRSDASCTEQWVVTLREQDEDTGGHQDEEIDFECWADDVEHAREQAANAYPGCNILAASRP